jgi:catechol 2,3-dioxygenase-like lactoylglutathione lyase family enzyme
MPIVKPVALDHVVLKCRNIEQSLMFYVDKLGLEPLRVAQWRVGEVPFPSVRINSTTIIDLFPGESSGTNVDHICIVVEPFDYDEITAALPGSSRGDLLFGAQGYASSVYTSDPDGNVIELRSYQRPVSSEFVFEGHPVASVDVDVERTGL